MKKTILMLFFYFLFCHCVLGATYYVDFTRGSDKSIDPTDVSTPWKTIAKVNDYAENIGFKDGDVIAFRRGSVWKNDETLGYDGNSVNWGECGSITIKDYGTGALPRFDNNTQQGIHFYGFNLPGVNLTVKNLDLSGHDWTYGSGQGNLQVTALSGNLTLDGIYINGTEGANIHRVRHGIKIGEIGGDVTIQNCIIKNTAHGNGPGVFGLDAHGIVYYVPSYPKSSGTVTIRNNQIYNVEGDCIHFAAIETTSNIYDNYLGNYGEDGIDLKVCKNINIYKNEFNLDVNTWGPGGSSSSERRNAIILHTPPEVSGNPGRIKIYQNLFTRGVVGVFINNGSDFSVVDNSFSDHRIAVRIAQGDGIDITGNRIQQFKTFDVNDDEWYHFSQISLIDYGSGMIQNCNISENEIVDGSSTIGKGILILASDENFLRYLIIKNNKITMMHNSSSVYPLFIDGAKNNMAIDGNTYYKPYDDKRVYWNGQEYNSPKFNRVSGDWNYEYGTHPNDKSGKDILNIRAPKNLRINTES